MRDDFQVRAKDELARRVSYLCSNPRCRRSTSGPQSQPTGSVNIGVAAHISAASPGGPRYDASLSQAERSAVGNGIWLCQACAKLVDNDEVGFTSDKLREWKADAEAAAAHALEDRLAPLSESEGVFLEAERLMPSLIQGMRTGIRSDSTELVREFVVLGNRNCGGGIGKPHFVYYLDDHPNLKLELDWLVENALVVDVSRGSLSTFRFVPEFAGWLREPT
jgi:hypothetical protein